MRGFELTSLRFMLAWLASAYTNYATYAPFSPKYALYFTWFLVDLEILPIAISLDNYCYLISDLKSNVSVLVDPADPEPIQVRASNQYRDTRSFATAFGLVSVGQTTNLLCLLFLCDKFFFI